ncbi:PREDICTED: CDGSH iron-sulfur domain-containing protein 1-like, partial [Thamnophis sirtalis]|uniref:CDGSH iron-sulfur domain-containing protein 1-like n=1 Tax=Thamnophis sirtalis TaxID=35019 RepID=A0A6I9X6X5_9SAUR
YFSLSVEWIAAVAFAAGTAAVGYFAYKKYFSKGKGCSGMVNLHIQKDNPKVVHAFDMEDLGEKAVYCRCWRSKTVREQQAQIPCKFFIVNVFVEFPKQNNDC